MSIEKQFREDLERREARATLENATPKDFETLKRLALDLFDQNVGYKALLLMHMRKDLIGTFEE